MKSGIILMTLLVILALVPIVKSYPMKVKILDVVYPSKVYNMEPFDVNIALYTSEAGGKIKVVLSYMGSELGSTESAILLALGGSSVNLTITKVKLPRMSDAYKLEFDAYWEAVLGGKTKEDSRTLVIQAVNIHFVADYDPRAIQTNVPFNLTFRLMNDGDDIAYGAEAELTSLARFTSEGPIKVLLGDVRPGEVRMAVFPLSTGITEFIGGTQNVVLTLNFEDWRKVPHSQPIEAMISLKVTQAALIFWIPVITFVIAIILFALFKAHSVKMGPVSIRTSRRSWEGSVRGNIGNRGKLLSPLCGH